MTERMIDADELLDWFEEMENFCRNNTGKNEFSSTTIKDKINELATTDTQPTVDLEDWQVGDTIRKENLTGVFELIVHGNLQERQEQLIKRGWTNLDATLRIKDKEIAELKAELAEKNSWCYDLDKMIDEWVLVRTHSGLYGTFDASAFIPNPEIIIAWMAIPEPEGNR